MTSDDRPGLLLVGPGMRLFREYLFASIGARYAIHLVNAEPPTWEWEYLAGATVVPSMDADVLVDAVAAELGGEHFDGVLTWDEARVLPAARIAAARGLPGGDPDVAWRCRDKHLTRAALAAAGVPQPASVLVDGLDGADGALAAADRLGYPVVLKPRAAAASYGVVLVADAEQLAARFAFADTATVPDAPRYDRAVLVEQYLDAPEVSVDSAVHDGQVLPVFLARKTVGFAPYFEETGHTVDATDPLLADPALLRVLHEAHAALGFTDGWTHAEFKLTADGPQVIEVNARLGGDLIPYLGLRATGIDPGPAAAAVACGLKPDVVPDRAAAAGVRFCYPERAGAVITSLAFDRAALPPEVDLAVTVAPPGTVTALPPQAITSGRLAFVTAVADTVAGCTAALDGAQRALRLELATT